MSGARGKWRWGLALGGLAAAWAALLWLPRGAEGPAAPDGRTLAATNMPGPTPSAVSPSPARPGSGAAEAVGSAAQSPGDIPAGLSAEQWQQLQAALAGHPQRDAEIRRITAFLQLQSRVQAFAEARRRGAPRSELLALAQPLQAELPSHLALGELSAGEALQLQAALLEVTEPDAGAAQLALAAWRTQYLAQAPGAARPDPREAAFAKARQAVVAQWQAGGSRDTQALEQELEALRRAHFDAKP